MEGRDGPGLGPSSTPDSLVNGLDVECGTVKSQQESSDAGSESNLARTGWFRVSATHAPAKRTGRNRGAGGEGGRFAFCAHGEAIRGRWMGMGCPWCSFAGGRAPLSDRSNAVGCLSRARIVSTKGLISLATSLASIVLQVVYEQERISGCFGDMSDAMRCCACDSASIVRTRASSA